MHASEQNKSDMPHDNTAEFCAYLARISREMDRFVIALLELENSSAEVIQHLNSTPSMEVLASFQKVDYLCQCSSALSEVLSRVAAEPNIDLKEVCRSLRPADLAERLMDQGLEDIDNTSHQTTIF